MRRLLVASAVVIAAIASPLLAGASVSDDQEAVTLTFVNRPVDETGIDIDGDFGLSPGDGWVSHAVLLKSGEVVGRVVNSCQYISVRADGMGGVLQCVSTMKLPDGQLAVQARIRLEEGVTAVTRAAITGGTGAYSDAGGVAVTEYIPGTMDSKVTLHIEL